MIVALSLFLLFMQAADVLTTARALELGGRELNPAMAWAFKTFGFWPAAIIGKLAALAVCAFCFAQAGPTYQLAGLVLVNCIYLAVVLNNLRVLERQES